MFLRICSLISFGFGKKTVAISVATDLVTGGSAVTPSSEATERLVSAKLWRWNGTLAVVATQQPLARHAARKWCAVLGLVFVVPTPLGQHSRCVFKVCLSYSGSLWGWVKLIQILKSLNYIFFSLLEQKLGQQPCPCSPAFKSLSSKQP